MLRRLSGILPPMPDLASAPDTPGYRQPPADIVAVLDTPPPPAGFLSPDGRTLLLADYEAYPPLATLARPYLKLAGIRIDPAINGHQRTSQYTGFSLLDTETGESKPVRGIPEGSRLGAPSWCANGARFAFTRDGDGGIEIGVCERNTGEVRFLPDLRVSDLLAGPFSWSDDGETLFVAQIPPDRPAAPLPPTVPQSPVSMESVGKFTKASTYQDLLQNDFDAAQFRYFVTVQLAFVNLSTGVIRAVGAPGAYVGAAWSPDEKYLCVSRLTEVSFRVPYSLFGKTVEVWNAQTGTPLATVATLPVRDEVPQQGVYTGARNITWQGNRDATLLWVEALDGGDPLAKVPHRDAIPHRFRAAFRRPPRGATPSGAIRRLGLVCRAGRLSAHRI